MNGSLLESFLIIQHNESLFPEASMFINKSTDIWRKQKTYLNKIIFE